MNNLDYNGKSAKSNTAKASKLLHEFKANYSSYPEIEQKNLTLQAIEAIQDESVRAECYRLYVSPDGDINNLLAGGITGERFTLRGTEYYLQDRPPIPYIVEGVIAEGSVSLWYGKFGSKKTWSLYDLGVCVASGKAWLEFAVNKCNVLIIDEESGERRLADRMKAILKGELVEGDIPLSSVSLAQFDLRSNPQDLAELILLIQETGAKLVIIDALADVMLGGDENAVKDTQPVFAGLRRASEVTGAAFVVIHHSNKQDGYRGSTAIAGALDTMLKVDSKAESDLITFKSEKVRDGEPINFAARAVWDNGGFFMQPAEKRSEGFFTTGEQYVINYLIKAGGEANVTAIKDNADTCEPATARKAVYSLANKGYICRIDTNASGVSAVYGFTEKGKKFNNEY